MKNISPEKQALIDRLFSEIKDLSISDYKKNGKFSVEVSPTQATVNLAKFALTFLTVALSFIPHQILPLQEGGVIIDISRNETFYCSISFHNDGTTKWFFSHQNGIQASDKIISNNSTTIDIINFLFHIIEYYTNN